MLKQYLNQDHIREYFDMLANQIFNKIPSSLREVNLFTRWGSFVQIEGDDSFISVNPSNSLASSIERGKSSFITQ